MKKGVEIEEELKLKWFPCNDDLPVVLPGKCSVHGQNSHSYDWQ
jgi:hypothetical protein